MNVLFGLRAGVQTLDNLLSRWLAEDGLTPGRFQVLVVLWAAEGAVGQREIVSALRVTRATVSGLIEALREGDHVQTEADGKDGRQILVALTSSGRAMTEQVVQKNAQRLREHLASLSDEELQTLLGLVSRASRLP